MIGEAKQAGENWGKSDAQTGAMKRDGFWERLVCTFAGEVKYKEAKSTNRPKEALQEKKEQ